MINRIKNGTPMYFKEMRKKLESLVVGRFILFWVSVAKDAYNFVRFGIALFFVRSLRATTLGNPIKRGCLRLTGVKTGHHLNIEEDVTIRAPWRLTLGSYTTIGKGVVITCAGGVIIEDYVLVGYGSRIISANHTIPEGDGLIRFAGHTPEQVRIAKGAWIGANCVILPGVTVGEGAVVAAGAVVTKDVSPYSIVGGVPAKMFRQRVRGMLGQAPG